MPVHLYGQCADWDAFTAAEADARPLLIEDAAQAFGATWNGVPAGALGDLAAFSFYPTKESQCVWRCRSGDDERRLRLTTMPAFCVRMACGSVTTTRRSAGTRGSTASRRRFSR